MWLSRRRFVSVEHVLFEASHLSHHPVKLFHLVHETQSSVHWSKSEGHKSMNSLFSVCWFIPCHGPPERAAGSWPGSRWFPWHPWSVHHHGLSAGSACPWPSPAATDRHAYRLWSTGQVCREKQATGTASQRKQASEMEARATEEIL